MLNLSGLSNVGGSCKTSVATSAPLLYLRKTAKIRCFFGRGGLVPSANEKVLQLPRRCAAYRRGNCRDVFCKGQPDVFLRCVAVVERRSAIAEHRAVRDGAVRHHRIGPGGGVVLLDGPYPQGICDGSALMPNVIYFLTSQFFSLSRTHF